MTEKKKAKRPKLISYRPPVDWEDEIKGRIARSGLSANAFITAALLGPNAPQGARRHTVDAAEVTRLLASTAVLADQLRALSVGASAQDAEALRAALGSLTEIRNAAFLALGRKP